MSSSTIEESLYIKEIKRFVDEEKNFSSTSDSESTCDEDRVKITGQPASSGSDDDYFNLKKRKKLQKYQRIQLLLSTSDEESGVTKRTPAVSSSEEDNSFSDFNRRVGVNFNVVTSKQPELSSASESEVHRETDKREVRVVSSGSSFVKFGLVSRKGIIKKKRRTNISEEKSRVDQNIRRAKEKSLNRTVSGQCEWRQTKTFGLPVDIRRRSISKEDNFHPDQGKLEVQDVVCDAIGEPHYSGVQTSKHQNRSIPRRRNSQITTSSNLHEEDQEMSNLGSFAQGTHSDEIYAGSYSPPPDSRSSAAGWSSSDSRTRSPFPSRESQTGFRDTSSIPKSPWFKGKAPDEKKALPLERALFVRCVRIEQSIQFSEFSSPFVQVNGEKYTVRPEQWHNIV